MYNPFVLLDNALLIHKIDTGKRFFVRQTYIRGLDPGLKAAFLLRAYEETERHLADQHLAFLANDAYAFLYDAEEPEHFQKLKIASQQPHGYKIYYAGKKGINWKPPVSYRARLREYIRKNHPEWRPKPGGEKIEAGIHEEFGRLFLTFRFGVEEEKVPFEEIEKL